MSMDFICDFLILAFFGRGDADVCHSLLCPFVCGSYSEIHVLSPVITFFKKFLSLWIRSRRWRHTSFRLSFCSIVRFLGTIFAHKFFMPNSSVNIWWTVMWFKFNSLAIIRTVSRRSDRTRARTLLSVFQVEGLKVRGSSLTLKRQPGVKFDSSLRLFSDNNFWCVLQWHKTSWLCHDKCPVCRHSGFMLLVTTVFLKFLFFLSGVRFDSRWPCAFCFPYLVLCIFVVIMCYKILL